MRHLNKYAVAIGWLATTLAGACGPGGGGPELDPLQDQIAKVGVELTLEIRATDPDGDDLTFSFESNVPGIEDRAQMTKRPDGSGLFRWTPQAADVGDGWAFDFTASDGGNSATVTIQIDVRSEIGQAGAPIFREPLGTGTTLDLSQNDCLDVPVVIEDPDSSSITLSMDEPAIDGSTLAPSSDGLSGSWHWCPSSRQIADDDRYMLTLGADDATNQKTIKHYLIVLRSKPKPDCPGAAPVVNHSPSDETTGIGLTITADISDDLGLKGEPLFYYSTTPPASTPDLGTMTQLTMVLLQGDMRSGTWGADVPNPVAGMPAGTSTDLYYVIVASDNDDLTGSCDHLTQAPSTATYSMTVTNPGGDGGAGLCEPCTADAQCGGSSDLCVRMGPMLDPYCMESCSGPSDCPADYTCSASTVTSVGGVSARQCIPSSGSCDDPGGTVCVDDSWEDNDSRTQAAANPALTTGTHSLVSCEDGAFSDDEDFFRIVLTGDSQVDISISGGTESDLDLALQDSTGTVIQSSVTLTSSESVSQCLEAGTYYVRVYAYSAEHNPYTLTYTRTSTSCGGTCDDDAEEDDDSLSQARIADIFPDPYVSTTNAICADDDDWYEIELYNGETVLVDLTFDQTVYTEDLDLHFHDGSGTDLTPCSEESPFTCSASQGQSATSNEHYEYTVADSGCLPCTFYVVVHGWSGSENLYDISIALE
jgi:hypothetical protein